ncbi:MAG TPA: hypothetical protein EYM53_05315 [Gammaproteobacteria bacterium]|nr:hypothetical protein [Gammaproteobacteria bacterium]
MKKRSILTIAIASCLTTQVMADTDIPTLPTVEIQTTQADQPQTFTIITRDETEGVHFTNINDAVFSGTPGVATSRRSETGFGGPNSGFIIRGLQGAHVPVFVDGIPIQVNNHNHSRTDRYSSDMAESIEIIRGPSVLKHGASAVGGVIDIYTRKPGQGTSGFIEAAMGTYNTKEVFGDVGHGWDDGSMLFSFSDRLTDGGPVVGKPFASDPHDLTNLNFKLTQAINNEWSVGFRAANTVEVPEHMPFTEGVQYSRYGQDETDLVVHLDRKTEDSNTLIAVHDDVLDNYSGKYTNGILDAGTAKTKKMTETGVLIKHTMQRGGGNDTTFGLHSVKYTDVQAKFNNVQKGSHISGYIEMNQSLDDNTRITGGVRVTSSDDFDTNISPAFGMVKKIDATLALRASAGKAFRVPRIGELDKNAGYNDTVLPEDMEIVQPEDFTHAEIGLNKLLPGGGTFDVVAWWMRGDNLIVDEPSGDKLYKVNTGAFDNRGLEASLTRPITAHLSVFAAVTVSSLETTRSTPQTFYDIGLDYRKDSVRANLNWRDARRNSDSRLSGDDYTVLDGRVQFDLTKDTTAFITMDNIGDTSYRTYYDKWNAERFNVGRLTMVGLNYKF